VCVCVCVCERARAFYIIPPTNTKDRFNDALLSPKTVLKSSST
jgi:hypothetical protein